MNEELIKEAASGEESSMEALIQNNAGLIWSIVKQFFGRGYETEDLYQIACIGFIKAVKRFNFEYNVKLSTYAVPYIFGEIKKFIRDDGIIKISRRKKELGLKIPVESINEESFEEGSAEKIEKILSSADDEQAKLVDKLAVNELVDTLNLRDKKIIKLRFYKEKTQTQVAEIMGISQVQVSRIEKKIISDFREKLLA